MEINQEKEVNRGLKVLAKASVWIFVAVLLSKIFAYIYRIIIARNFGPEIYGVFSLAVSIFGLFITVSSFGLMEGLLRYIPLYRGKNETQKIKYLFRLVLKIVLVSGIFFSLLLFFSADFISGTLFHNSGLAIFLKYLSTALVVSLIAGVFLIALRSYEEIWWYSTINHIILNFFKLIFLVLFLFLGVKSDSAILSYILGIFVWFVLSYLICKYKIPILFDKYILKKEIQKKISKEIFYYSFPLLFYGIIASFFYWIDSFSIGYFKTVAEVGLYNSAVPIALFLGIVPELFIQLFFPLIVGEYSKENFGTIRELSKQVSKWIFMLNLPIFLLIIIFPGAAINLLFGSEYLMAKDALRFLALSAFFSSVFVVSTQLISMKGKSNLVLLNIALASILNIALNYFLIPMSKILFIENPIGITGAAIATTISVIFLNLLFFFQVKYYLGFVPLRKKMISIGFISLLPLVSLFYLRNRIRINFLSVVLLSFSFVLIYFLFVLLLKGFDRNDRMIIALIKNKFLRK